MNGLRSLSSGRVSFNHPIHRIDESASMFAGEIEGWEEETRSAHRVQVINEEYPNWNSPDRLLRRTARVP
jgi:hypothetical protein